MEVKRKIKHKEKGREKWDGGTGQSICLYVIVGIESGKESALEMLI